MIFCCITNYWQISILIHLGFQASKWPPCIFLLIFKYTTRSTTERTMVKEIEMKKRKLHDELWLDWPIETFIHFLPLFRRIGKYSTRFRWSESENERENDAEGRDAKTRGLHLAEFGTKRARIPYGVPSKQKISYFLNYRSRSTNATPCSVYFRSPFSRWVANNDFPHVPAPFTPAQCGKLQWLRGSVQRERLNPTLSNTRPKAKNSSKCGCLGL